ncbi:MAG TPA: KTSC domain-containing protein [Bryobacteraceae bacterium]|nr:KTSC domain-containing protein [Bryobacteraceae bacterium]
MTWLPLESVSVSSILARKDSKMFFSVAYDADTRRSGDVYRYFHFSEADHQQFLRSESKGGHFLSNIRKCFPYERFVKLQVA